MKQKLKRIICCVLVLVMILGQAPVYAAPADPAPPVQTEGGNTPQPEKLLAEVPPTEEPAMPDAAEAGGETQPTPPVDAVMGEQTVDVGADTRLRFIPAETAVYNFTASKLPDYEVGGAILDGSGDTLVDCMYSHYDPEHSSMQVKLNAGQEYEIFLGTYSDAPDSMTLLIETAPAVESFEVTPIDCYPGANRNGSTSFSLPVVPVPRNADMVSITAAAADPACVELSRYRNGEWYYRALKPGDTVITLTSGNVSAEIPVHVAQRTPMTLNQMTSYRGSDPRETVEFEFTPQENGVYSFYGYSVPVDSENLIMSVWGGGLYGGDHKIVSHVVNGKNYQTDAQYELKAGTTYSIGFSYGNFGDHFDLGVAKAPALEGLQSSETSLNLREGDDFYLPLEPVPAHADLTGLTAVTGDANVAAVEVRPWWGELLYVTAKGSGQTDLTLTCGAQTLTIPVTVAEAPGLVEGERTVIEFTPESTELRYKFVPSQSGVYSIAVTEMASDLSMSASLSEEGPYGENQLDFQSFESYLDNLPLQAELQAGKEYYLKLWSNGGTIGTAAVLALPAPAIQQIIPNTTSVNYPFVQDDGFNVFFDVVPLEADRTGITATSTVPGVLGELLPQGDNIYCSMAGPGQTTLIISDGTVSAEVAVELTTKPKIQVEETVTGTVQNGERVSYEFTVPESGVYCWTVAMERYSGNGYYVSMYNPSTGEQKNASVFGNNPTGVQRKLLKGEVWNLSVEKMWGDSNYTASLRKAVPATGIRFGNYRGIAHPITQGTDPYRNSVGLEIVPEPLNGDVTQVQITAEGASKPEITCEEGDNIWFARATEVGRGKAIARLGDLTAELPVVGLPLYAIEPGQEITLTPDGYEEFENGYTFKFVPQETAIYSFYEANCMAEIFVRILDENEHELDSCYYNGNERKPGVQVELTAGTTYYLNVSGELNPNNMPTVGIVKAPPLTGFEFSMNSYEGRVGDSVRVEWVHVPLQAVMPQVKVDVSNRDVMFPDYGGPGFCQLILKGAGTAELTVTAGDVSSSVTVVSHPLPEMELDVEKIGHQINGPQERWKFVPTETGVYSFFGTDVYDAFLNLELRDEYFSLLSSQTWSQQSPKELQYRLEAGKTYYLCANARRGYGQRAEEGYFGVMLSKALPIQSIAFQKPEYQIRVGDEYTLNLKVTPAHADLTGLKTPDTTGAPVSVVSLANNCLVVRADQSGSYPLQITDGKLTAETVLSCVDALTAEPGHVMTQEEGIVYDLQIPESGVYSFYGISSDNNVNMNLYEVTDTGRVRVGNGVYGKKSDGSCIVANLSRDKHYQLDFYVWGERFSASFQKAQPIKSLRFQDYSPSVIYYDACFGTVSDSVYVKADSVLSDLTQIGWKVSDPNLVTITKTDNDYAAIEVNGNGKVTVTAYVKGHEEISTSMEVNLIPRQVIQSGDVVAVKGKDPASGVLLYTPETTGTVTLMTSGSCKTYITVQQQMPEGYWDTVAYGEENQPDGNTRLTVNLIKGVHYAIGTSCTEGNGSYQLYVGASPVVESITLDRETVVGFPGEEVYLGYTAAPDFAQVSGLRWTTDNAQVATAANGYVKLVGAGTAHITLTEANGASDTVTVTVLDRPALTVDKELSAVVDARVGKQQFVFAPALSDTYHLSVGKTDAYKDILVTDGAGKVVAHAGGMEALDVQFYAIFGETYMVELIPHMAAADTRYVLNLTRGTAAESIRFLEGSAVDTTRFTQFQLHVTYLPELAVQEDLTWTTSDPTVAVVTDGLVKVVGEGKAEIKAATNSGKTAVFTVNAAAPAPITAGKDQTVQIKNALDSGVFAFTPAVTGTYRLEKIGNSDASCVLLGAEGAFLHTFENGLDVELTGGTVYYLSTDLLDDYGTGTYKIRITETLGLRGMEITQGLKQVGCVRGQIDYSLAGLQMDLTWSDGSVTHWSYDRDGMDLGSGFVLEVTSQIKNYEVILTLSGGYATQQITLPIVDSPVLSFEIIDSQVGPLDAYSTGYWEGDRFIYRYPTDQITFRVSYADGTQETVQGTSQELTYGGTIEYRDNQRISPWYFGPGTNNVVIFSYMGAEAYLYVVVKSPAAETIRLDQAPALTYVMGDTEFGYMDAGGYHMTASAFRDLRFTVSYKDGTSQSYSGQDIRNDFVRGDLLNGFNIRLDNDLTVTAPGTYPVKVTYQGLSFTYNVEVKAPQVTNISILKNQDQQTVKEGYLPAATGMQLGIDKADGTNVTVTVTEANSVYRDGCCIVTDQGLKLSIRYEATAYGVVATVECEGVSVSQTVAQIEKEASLESVSASQPKPNTDTMNVTLNYFDGTSENVDIATRKNARKQEAPAAGFYRVMSAMRAMPSDRLIEEYEGTAATTKGLLNYKVYTEYDPETGDPVHYQVELLNMETQVEVSKVPQFTVEFRDWDGTLISAETYYLGDEILVPADPSRAADETYRYTFAGWDQPVVPCEGRAVYTATYTAEYIQYTYEFRNSDGTLLASGTCHYGDTIAAPADPQAPEGTDPEYIFRGWNPAELVCTGNMVFTAVFGPRYDTGDINRDGTVDNADVIYLLWHTLFPAEYPLDADADFNQDGRVDNTDVIYLLWHTLFPAEYPLAILPKKYSVR